MSDAGDGRRPTGSDLERARELIPWVEDHELVDVERRSPMLAAMLSFFSFGGGQMYTHGGMRGAAYLSGAIGVLILLANVLPALIPVFAVGALLASAVDAHRRARRLTRFARLRSQLALATADLVPQHKLAGPIRRALGPAAAPAAPPASAAHAELIARLDRLAALRRGGVISDGELRERKVDLLQAAAPDDRDALDALLFDLLPLVDRGVLDASDVEFLKQVAGGTVERLVTPAPRALRPAVGPAGASCMLAPA